MHTGLTGLHPPIVTIAAVPQSHAVPPCAQVGGSPATAPCASCDRKWILIATILGSALALMDSSVVNVALPMLQSAFHATSAGIQWVIQSYALFGAALLLLGGTMGDRYGRRKIYVFGVTIFALGSAACAASFSLGQLIAARSVQGIGAALLVPQGLSIISASFPAEERGRAIGTWSAWTSVFAALGPVAGGWLMQVWSWRLIFLLNLPLALLVLLLARRIPESRALTDDGKPLPLDRLGASLATLSFAAIIYALSFAPQLGWQSPQVLWLLIGGLALLAAFLWSQADRHHAMMPLRLFRNRRFLAANLLTVLLYGALGGTLYTIPFYLIQVRHFAPAAAGAVFLPLIVLMFLFSARVGSLVPKLGDRVLLVTGAALCGAGFAAFAVLDGQRGYAMSILPGVLILGCGMTLVVAPLTTAVMSSVPENETGVASAVNNALSRLAALVAVSFLALVLAHEFAASLGDQLERSSLPVEVRQRMFAERSRLHDVPIPAALAQQDQAEAVKLLDRSFLSGFRAVMFTSALCAWGGALAVFLLLPGNTATEERRD